MYFGSSTKNRELSNLYSCLIEYKGERYNSLEHVYQSLKFKPKQRHRFTVGGDLGDFDALLMFKQVFYTKKTTEQDVYKKIDYWGKRNCIGIVAKMASNKKHSKKLGLSYIGVDDDVFYDLLKLKFAIPEFRDLLLDTKDEELVEFSRFAKTRPDQEKWGGMIVDGKLYGENKMGKMIMKTRSYLQTLDLDLLKL